MTIRIDFEPLDAAKTGTILPGCINFRGDCSPVFVQRRRNSTMARGTICLGTIPPGFINLKLGLATVCNGQFATDFGSCYSLYGHRRPEFLTTIF